MRLFLSSQDLGKYPEVARKMAGQNNRAAFIKNAQDDKLVNERNFSIPLKKEMFEAAGFEFEEVDLRDYFGKQDELTKKLASFGSVWCAGGNTFILRRAMKASGLDEILKDWIPKDKIMYGGWSAGACVAGQSLHGVEHGDFPGAEVVPESYPNKETIWDGLGIVDFVVVPHYNSDWFGEEAERMRQHLEKLGTSYYLVEDGQVVVVQGDEVELVK